MTRSRLKRLLWQGLCSSVSPGLEDRVYREIAQEKPGALHLPAMEYVHALPLKSMVLLKLRADLCIFQVLFHQNVKGHQNNFVDLIMKRTED